MLITNSCQSPLHFQARFNSNSLLITEDSVQEEECVTNTYKKTRVLLKISVFLLIPSAVCKEAEGMQLPIHLLDNTTHLSLGCK